MSTYRSSLEAGFHPPTDPRRGPEFRAELERFAETLTPMWRRTRERDDFGYALLRIGARLAEQSTVRLDASARRDALAFFDFLGLPPGPPHPATGVLVLVLDPKLVAPVHAPARTQVSVTTAEGGQVTFESQSRIRLIPGGIAELYSVDPSTDRIDKAPTRVTSAVSPTPWADIYSLVTFSGSGSLTVQLSPLAGLKEQDLLEIGRSVHRVKEEKDNGLVTLMDALEAPANANDPATRVTQFRAFDLRNVQRHEVHIGHGELLNLKQPATITLDVAPASLAGELGALDIDFALFGTREKDTEPEWHPIDFLDVSGAHLRLAKTWSGTVDETEVSGHKNRWLRARLRTPIEGRTSATKRAADLRITVASAEDADAPENGASHAQASSVDDGSRTVLHAAHNGTPLATAGRFHPFGAEPTRFDTFALAAPEALSKKDAMMSLAFGLSDSSMESFGVSAPTLESDQRESWHGFGAGRNGYLQMVRGGSTSPRWIEMRVTGDDGQQIILGSSPPVAVELSDDADVVVLEDRGGRWWSGVVQLLGTPPTATVLGSWHPITRLSAQNDEDAEKMLVMATPSTMESTSVAMVAVSGGALYTRVLDANGMPDTEWRIVSNTVGGQKTPQLSSISFLVGIQGPTWPRRPDVLEVVVRDVGGGLWIGILSPDTNQGGFDIRWTAVEQPTAGPDERAVDYHPAVAPTATRYMPFGDAFHVWVSFATGSQNARPKGLCGLDIAEVNGGGFEVQSTQTDPDVEIGPDSALHTHSTVRGVAGYPAVVGVEATGANLVIWQWEEESTVVALPGNASSGRPLIVSTGVTREAARPEVLLPGSGERLLRTRLAVPEVIEYALHDCVEMYSEGNWAPDRLYIAEDFDDPDTSTELNFEDVPPRIFEHVGNQKYHRVFEVDLATFSAGNKLRFLRLEQTKAGGGSKARSYAGTFVDQTEPTEPVDGAEPGGADPTGDQSEQKPPTMLRLAKDDDITKVGTRIVIGMRSFTVTAIDEDRVTTLNTHVDNASAEYYVADNYAEGSITADNLGTLVRLEDSHVPEVLAFPAPAAPRVQRVLRKGSGRDPVWAQLARSWTTKPDDGSLTIVAEDYSRCELARPRDYRNPELSWEYFDGEAWQQLVTGFVDGTANLSTSGKISFVVPRDLTTTEIGGKEDYWIRARLIGGDYGRPTYRVTTSDKEDGVTTQSVVVDTSELNPPEIITIEASFSSPAEGVLPEAVLVENNGDVLDQTQAATVPTATFELFQGAAALNPVTEGRAVFAGLTGPVEAGSFTLFVDAEDRPGRGTLDVDVLTPDGWQRVAVDDETASMRRTGLIHLSLDRTPVPLRLFGKDRVWLRFRAGDDSAAGTRQARADDDPWEPVVRSLLPNAVPISHATTMGLETLGSSLGEPGTTVFLTAVPVLPDSVELRVREDLSEEERTTLEEQHRGRRGTSADAVVTDAPGAPGTWVLWQRVDSLIGQDRDARVYVLEPSTGRVTFGDDRAGRIPPAGSDGIRCFSYQQGGGAEGNVPAWAETRLTSAVAGVETAALPLGTAGGADSPPADAVFATAPHRLRHTGRAVAPVDVEDLVVASSGDILRARCLRPDVPGGPLRVAVVVRDRTSRRPQPTHAQRDAVAAYLCEAGWGGLDNDAVKVTGPAYAPVVVNVELIAPPESWAEVEHIAKERLIGFFDPERGGPYGAGWAFGRRPTTVDLLRVLHGVPGLDRIAGAAVTGPNGAPVGEMSSDGVVCAEAADITVTVSGEGNAS